MLQQLINGLTVGSIYALIALGYTMVYGILSFINFAHGDVFMLGAFIGFYAAKFLSSWLGLSGFWLSVPVFAVSIIGCAAVGVSIEKLVYKPLRNKPKITILITAIGVSLFLEFGGQWLFGPDPKGFPTLIPNVSLIDMPNLVVGSLPVTVIAITFFLAIALRFIIFKTRMGTAMRAVSNNMPAASLVGINVDNVISFTFALGSALAAIGGILYASMYPSINPLMGIMPGLKAFIAAVLGGIGNLPGAILGGFVIGMVETLITGYWSPTYRDAIAFGILIVVLLVKPTGLFGKNTVEKV